MALDNAERMPARTGRIADDGADPLHPVGASGRELRAQSVHRLQLGLFGLCAMLLIVGLASIIMERAQTAQPDDPIEQVIAADDPTGAAAVDPLADAGVVPAADPTAASGKPTAAAKPAR